MGDVRLSALFEPGDAVVLTASPVTVNARLRRNSPSEPPSPFGISMASRTVSVRMWSATRHPTIIREKASVMKDA